MRPRYLSTRIRRALTIWVSELAIESAWPLLAVRLGFREPSVMRESSPKGRSVGPRPLYLVCGRKIGRVGATDRPRPWSIKKTQKKSLGRRALPLTTRKESPNSCLGHFLLRRRGELVSARTGL